jgi:hypothetical protein
VRKSNASLRKMYSEAELEKRRSASAIVEAQKQRCAQEVLETPSGNVVQAIEKEALKQVLARGPQATPMR